MQSASFTFNLGGLQPKSPITIFHLGQSFFLAGSRCLLNIDVGPNVVQCLVSPGVVNLCLAIELFLKSIVVLNGGSPAKTHKLIDLFTAIPQNDLLEVKTRYSQLVQQPTFDELVTQVSNYFVEVRYGHEFGVFSFNEYPIFVLAKVLYIHAATLHNSKCGIEGIQA